MEINIRQVDQQDITEVFKQIIELGKYLNLEDKIVITEKSLEEILFDNNPYSMKGIIAEVENNIVGFALYTFSGTNLVFNPTYCIYLDELYVKPNYRGQKIGSKLLKHIVKIADIKNCKRIEWYVNDGNERAREFYLKIGAILIPNVRVYKLENQAFESFLLTKD